MDALKVLMAHEISRSDSNNPALLFRANSLASKLLDHYMKIKAITPYLHNTLGKLLGRICAISESCEVDPGRVESGASAAQNAKVLQGLVTNIWNSILQSVDKLPVELVELFSHIRMKCMEKYSGDEASQYSAVSGFIFLRFFCPAIITPKLFGMATELPSPVTARNLTLIAKILQNLANLVEFGGAKEPYMVEFNPFIRSNIEAMKFFLQKISQPRIEPYSGSGSGGYSVASSSSFSTATTTPSSSNTTTSVDRRRAYEQLYRLFRSNLPVTSLSAARGGVELMGAMNRLQNMHQRISSPSSSGDGNLLSIMGDKYSMATSAHKSSTIHTNNDGDNTIPVTSSASTSSVASATSASLLQPLPRNDSMSSLKSSSILSIQSVSSFSSSSADDAAAPEVPSKSISDLLPPTLPPRTTPINKLGIDFKFGNFWKDYQSKKAAAAAASIGGARNSGGGSASEKRRGAVANSIHVGDMQDYYLSALSSLETAPTSDQLLVGISEEEEEEVDQDRGISSLLSSQATSESTIVSPTSPSSSSARFFGKFTTSISSKHSDGEDSTSLVDVSATSPTSSKTSKRMSLGAMIKSVRL